jgi:hypothetical protein
MHSTSWPRCGFVFAALASLATLPAQITATVPCAADNTLYQTIAGDASNGAGTGIFVGQNAFGSIRRAVLRFDVAAALPAGAKVLTAQLSLNVVQSTVALAHPITGHRLLQSWGEGTSIASGGGGGGGPATTGDATWLHRFWNTTFWTTPGGDFAATPSFTASMPSIGAFSTNLSRAAADDVQSWLNNPATNFGWLLKTVNETLSSTAHRIESRESVVEWVRSSILTEYESRLSPDLWSEYLAAYRERLLPRLADERPYFFTFRRVLMHASR